jgi:hypothetical protein
MFTKLEYLGNDRITCDVDGFRAYAWVERDDDAEPPWSRGDDHGPVSEWTTREKRPGEVILSADGGARRYYDMAEAVRIARRESWDAEPYGVGTAGERAARAARADYDNLKAWCDDEWTYVGVCVAISRKGVRLTDKYDHALWGIESNAGDYLTEVANERLSEALAAAKDKLAELCACPAEAG